MLHIVQYVLRFFRIYVLYRFIAKICKTIKLWYIVKYVFTAISKTYLSFKLKRRQDGQKLNFWCISDSVGIPWGFFYSWNIFSFPWNLDFHWQRFNLNIENAFRSASFNDCFHPLLVAIHRSKKRYFRLTLTRPYCALFLDVTA